MKDLAALGLISDFITKFPRKASEAFESFLPEQQLEIIEQLPASSSAILMKRVNPDIAAQLLQQTKSVIKIIKASDPALMVRILLRIEEKARKSILDQLPASLAKEIEGLSSYPLDSAGSWKYDSMSSILAIV
ncbi:magnesium transporter MgtE N-terminal domain-containing protein [Pseudobacteriovorax antillogorgiicola]|uniref:MgtE intracellular N domain-containing protein n=1 Tax=Pseudobacteriovorax antillogorgiicola TaxID=1513793 RepID=A0A1Y6CMQ1_9BACT|nr:hypothetical protein [Pseudobacteriovorax antillogorgiicola]TCS44809.1 MgtE-like protein [Pseudobacteriovorax antillogorgiicola]SMF77304.1 MgtE intracellular N domain-containing protein [Pseudobacteriovorax antillogorgiicola]